MAGQGTGPCWPILRGFKLFLFKKRVRAQRSNLVSGDRRQWGCVLANCAIDGMLLLNLGTKSAGSASASIDGLTASPLLIDMAPTSCCIHTFIADVRLPSRNVLFLDRKSLLLLARDTFLE